MNSECDMKNKKDISMYGACLQVSRRDAKCWLPIPRRNTTMAMNLHKKSCEITRNIV